MSLIIIIIMHEILLNRNVFKLHRKVARSSSDSEFQVAGVVTAKAR